MNTTHHTKHRWWTWVLAKGKQFLPLVRHPPCFSFSPDVFDTTLRKQTEITKIRHALSYKQLGMKTNQASFLCGNRSRHHNMELRICLFHKFVHLCLTESKRLMYYTDANIKVLYRRMYTTLFYYQSQGIYYSCVLLYIIANKHEW